MNYTRGESMSNLPFLFNYQSEKVNLNNLSKDIDFRNNMRKIYGSNLEITKEQDTVLIFTRLHDDEVNFIGPYLAKENINYIRIDADYFLDDFKMTTSITGGHVDTIIYYKDELINMSNVKLIWNRHFDKEAFRSNLKNPVAIQYVLQEWEAVLNFLYQIPHIKWINNPVDTKAASKPQQLIMAGNVGFKVLDTMITNVPADVLNISKDKEIFFKASHHHFVEYPAGILNSLYGKKLDDKDKTKMGDLVHCPMIFQEMVTNLEEVRVTVFNDLIFSAKYTNKISDDWHHDELTKIKLEEIETPEVVKIRCINMLKCLNLQYGAFDFFKTDDDNWIFIEVNPIGDWRWVELKTNFHITISFVEFIKEMMWEVKCNGVKSL